MMAGSSSSRSAFVSSLLRKGTSLSSRALDRANKIGNIFNLDLIEQQQQQQQGGAAGGGANSSQKKTDDSRRKQQQRRRQGQMSDMGVVSASDILSESELKMLQGLKTTGGRATAPRPLSSSSSESGHDTSVSIKSSMLEKVAPSQRRAADVRILRGSLGPSTRSRFSFLQKHRWTIMLFLAAWFVYQLFISPRFIAPMVQAKPELIEESQEQP